jgi:hypothetical protein
LKLPIGVMVSFLTTTSRRSASDSASSTNWGVCRNAGSIRSAAAAMRDGDRSVRFSSSVISPSRCHHRGELGVVQAI